MTNAERATAIAHAADGTALAYQHRGAGPPLMLLAGQGNDHHWWDDVREDFHGARSTVTMDYRGTGASGSADEPCSTRGFAADVVAVLDDLGTDSADVYGASMGGRVAQWIAAEHPRRVRRLVLGCTSPGGQHAVERNAAVRRALTQPDPGAAREALLDLMFTPGWLARNPGPHPVLGDSAMPARAQRNHLVASNRHDAWDVLPHIAAPTLVLHGDEDLLTPVDNAALLASRIPDARVHLLAGARHAYFRERRAEASALVNDFLAE